MRHHSPAGTFTRVPGRCLRWSPTSQGPRWPPAYRNIKYKKFYVYSDDTHTHTPCLRQGGARKHEMKMRMNRGWKMRWEWKWDESYLTRTRRGERKRRGKEKTHTNTPSPERANPEKAREKKKRRADGHGPRPTEGGEDGSAWTNLTQRKPTKTSARDGANLPGEGRKHEIGDQWGTSWWKQNQTTNRIQFLDLEFVRLCHNRPVFQSATRA